jgi:hypothetical protein
LSIVAAYLEAPDQLVMRQVDALMHKTVDPKIDVLTMTGKEAHALFSYPNAFRALRALRVTDCGDSDLIDLAAVLKTLPHKSFELILDGEANTFVSAQGLNALTELACSRITVRGLDISSVAAQALARSASPVSISLPARMPQDPSLYSFLQIPTLTSLHASPHRLTSDITSAVASHACLREFSVGLISSGALRDIARSATIESICIFKIEGDEVGPLNALAANSVLRSLTILHLHLPESLAILSRNSSLRSIILDVSRDAASGIPHLANMPRLEALSLSGGSAASRLLRAENVQALCANTFISLSLHDWDIEPAAQALIAATPSHHLSLNHCTPFSDAAIDVLLKNQSIASLSIDGEIVPLANVIALAGSPTLRYLHIGLCTLFSAGAKNAINDAWRAAHKPLANLQLQLSELGSGSL